MKHSIETAIDIPAPPHRVWSVLTATEHYPDWNPFVRSLTGRLAVGEQLTVELGLGDRPMTFRPRVTVYEPERELRWLGHLFVPGLFDGEHRFRLEPTAAGHTHFVHDEQFRGWLVGPILRRIRAETSTGFRLFNEALREQATRRVEADGNGQPD